MKGFIVNHSGKEGFGRVMGIASNNYLNVLFDTDNIPMTFAIETLKRAILPIGTPCTNNKGEKGVVLKTKDIGKSWGEPNTWEPNTYTVEIGGGLQTTFSENEIVEMSIYQIDEDKKTLQVVSDRARPFVKNFDFIKGFEGGKLEYESIISEKVSNSNLTITDFKVSKVPALAKLLTLASLQGIADTLSGEGIRFESFEMKSNSKGNVINIEDALAIGPAISILLEGYVDKGKIVSLRGTLVPATKLNSIIASIPVVGNILVGKKIGEGVVGVSFKMKGPPKDIKTTVNPIKTLTPRFIVRAIEKLKRQKKEETK